MGWLELKNNKAMLVDKLRALVVEHKNCNKNVTEIPQQNTKKQGLNYTTTIQKKVDKESKDFIFLIDDEVMLNILSRLPNSDDPYPYSLVCKKWMLLQGRLRHKIKLKRWEFLTNGRMTKRFPNLREVDLCAVANESIRLMPPILLSHDWELTVPLGDKHSQISVSGAQHALLRLAQGCPSLQKLRLFDGYGGTQDEDNEGCCTSLGGLVGGDCVMLQELEIHRCTDESLSAVPHFTNLQILRIVASVEGLYQSSVTDIGLTLLARNCTRLVKLELCGCQGSYDGIAAIGQCCVMLEELIISNNEMEEGWTSGLSFCGNLKTLKLKGCKKIDENPGPSERLGCCSALEKLHLQGCNMRDMKGFKALMMHCESVRDLIFQNCWGLDDDIFSLVTNCRRVRCLVLEGCSVLTTVGLEIGILSMKELQNLQVVSCKSIKDTEISPYLATLFSHLKELKWRPDSNSVLVSTISNTRMVKKGGKFLKRI